MENCILEARDASFSYGKRRVLHEISACIPQGAYVSLVGPNGSGKSTLLHLLSGAYSCESGSVLYQGKDVARMAISLRARQFATVRQQEENKFPFSCLDMVIFGLHPQRSRFSPPTEEQMETVRSVMIQTDTWALCDQPVTQISGGELQRVVLARALVQNPRVLFLDEAMSDFDIRVKIQLTGYLRERIARTNLTVVAVNHDLAAAYRYSDSIIALKDGRVAACGTPQEVMTPAFFANVFGVEAEVLGDKGFFIRDQINQPLVYKGEQK